jgi:hypothetical protein
MTFLVESSEKQAANMHAKYVILTIDDFVELKILVFWTECILYNTDNTG